MTSWGYRILRQENPGETGLVSDHVCGIAEVFFDDQLGIEAWTGLVKPCGETASEVVEDLMHMLQGAWNGPLDEATLPRDRKPAWAEEVDPATCISLEECRERLEAKFGALEPAEPQPEPVLFLVRHSNGVFLGREVVLGEAAQGQALLRLGNGVRPGISTLGYIMRKKRTQPVMPRPSRLRIFQA